MTVKRVPLPPALQSAIQGAALSGASLRDVSKQVTVGVPQGRALPLVTCACGHLFEQDEGVIEPMALHARAQEMPCCGRRFVWQQTIIVFEVVT